MTTRSPATFFPGTPPRHRHPTARWPWCGGSPAGGASAGLPNLVHGAIGEAVAEAASYADVAISETTRAAYLQAWAHFDA